MLFRSVSPESITASVPSHIACATSDTSARVGREALTIDGHETERFDDMLGMGAPVASAYSIDAGDTWSAGICQYCHRLPLRRRAPGQRPRPVKKFLHGISPQDARPPEGRRVGFILAGERACV